MFGNIIAPRCDDTLGGRISIAREACGISAEDAAQAMAFFPRGEMRGNATAIYRAPIG